MLSGIVIYGIEGKHYTNVSDNVIKLIPNSGYDMSTNQWMIGNVYNAYTKDTENPDKYVELKNFDDSATVSAICGFRFVTEPVQAEIAACKAVEKQFETQIALGAIDPTTVIDEYRKNLESSGINKIINDEKYPDAYGRFYGFGCYVIACVKYPGGIGKNGALCNRDGADTDCLSVLSEVFHTGTYRRCGKGIS